MKETRVLISGVRGPGQQGSLLLTSDMLVVISNWLLVVGHWLPVNRSAVAVEQGKF